jgi:hypothetical protein
MTAAKREALRMMFGGRCAYCGCELTGKWHADHVEAVNRDGNFVRGKWKLNGKLRRPENDREDNLYPACVRCNILKGATNVEGFRSMLAYFAHSIPTIATYSHVHHLMRFNRLHIDPTPVIFWFEQYRKEQAA